jgi:hypothetical protein
MVRAAADAVLFKIAAGCDQILQKGTIARHRACIVELSTKVAENRAILVATLPQADIYSKTLLPISIISHFGSFR